jgi:hypothetical protein
MPESETLNSKAWPQKAQRPVVIGFINRLGLPFTNNTPLDPDCFVEGLQLPFAKDGLDAEHYVVFREQCQGHVDRLSCPLHGGFGYANSASTRKMATEGKPSI